MLKELNIENLAVIEKADVKFSDSFNVFTGETGAGKSILIHGINAVIGQRVTKDIVRTGSKKAVVTALFSDLGEITKRKLDEYGVDCEDGNLIMTREIKSDGGSVARINGRVSSVSEMKDIGETLIQIHGQHDSRILQESEKHLEILDSFGGDSSFSEEYTADFRHLQDTAKKLVRLRKLEQTKAERIELLNIRLSDLSNADLKEPDEDEEIEKRYKLIQQTEQMTEAFNDAIVFLTLGNENAVEKAMSAENSIADYTDSDKETSELYDRLVSARIEMQDISDGLRKILNGLDRDEGTLQRLSDRRDELNRLKKKYMKSLPELIEMLQTTENELGELESSGAEIEKLEQEKEMLLEKTTKSAGKLSEYRKQTAKKFVKAVTEELKFLDMPNVTLKVDIKTGKLTSTGMDTVEFLISANKGEEPKPISKIASGGELSRIMLSIKNVMAGKDFIPSLIFDEIDTGVSGRAAQKIGVKLREISNVHQVLCVTHLAQIAVMAENHILIEKNTVKDRTITTVTELGFEQRKYEIARIMGGENPSELMLENAQAELERFHQ